MTPEQARDFQKEAKRLQARMRAGHVDPEDVIILARLVEEILAHLAHSLEIRAQKPKRNAA